MTAAAVAMAMTELMTQTIANESSDNDGVLGITITPNLQRQQRCKLKLKYKHTAHNDAGDDDDCANATVAG